MQRSKTTTKGRPITAALFVFVLAAPLLSAPPKARPYHLELESTPAKAFPYLSKFGTISLDVYPGGVRAESFWLNGFTRNGSKTVTVLNPVMRMYSDVPIEEIASIIGKLAAGNELEDIGPERIDRAVSGKVGTLRAARHRMVYGPEAWIDIWMTSEIPENAQLRAVLDGLIAGISKPTAKAARTLRGTPVYVELNFRRFKKVQLLRLKSLTLNNTGEAEALKVGSYYFKAPILDAIWK